MVRVHDRLRYEWWHNVLLVGLDGVPTEFDINHLRVEVEHYAASHAQRIVILIQFRPTGVPDASTRAAFARFVRVLDSTASYGAFILEASGFWAATIRSVQVGVELSSGGSFRMDYCRSTAAALERAQPWIVGPENLSGLKAAAQRIPNGQTPHRESPGAA
jgi:hypothetical protein